MSKKPSQKELEQRVKELEKQAAQHKQLSGEQDLYENVLDGIINGVWVTGKDEVIHYANRGMEKIAGVPKQQLVGAGVLTDFPESTLKHFRAHYLKAKATLEPVYYDAVPVVTPSQRQSYQSGWLIPRVKDSNFEGMICTVEDITERKQAEETLRESEEASRSMSMELALSLSEVFEALREISSGNPEVRIPETSGFELITKLKHMVNVTAENLAEIVDLSHEFAIGLAEHFDALNRVSRGDLTAQVSGTSQVELLECLGKVTNQMIESVSREITERKQAEKALQEVHAELEQRVEERTAELSRTNEQLRVEIAKRTEVEKKLRTERDKVQKYLDVAGVMLLAMDADQKVTLMNKKGGEVLGYDEKDIIGKNWFDNFLPHRLRKEVLGVFKKLVAGEIEPVEYYENPVLTKSGEERIVAWHNTVLHDEKGRFISTVVSGEDITERKRAEEDRQALIAELEAKNAALERFTYTVSHDLKSPLITIKGFLGLLAKDMAEGEADRVNADMQRISDAADKMNQLLGDLLQLSRVGLVVNTPEEVPLGDLAQEAMNSVHGRLNAQAVKVEIRSGLPTVYADRTRLREALENLIDNAVKFMGNQPDPRVEIGVRRDGESQVFFVRDNGTGIDPEYHEKVFGLFDRLDDKTDGAGVGLAIVRRIVEVHGGRIWVESEGTGHGSTFCFTLPDKSETTGK